MEMIIDFPGGSRVDAHFGPFSVPTDQPPESSAPTPFATFLSTIGTCAGIYVVGFCRQRGIDTDGIRLVQKMDVDRLTGMVTDVQVTICSYRLASPKSIAMQSSEPPTSARSRAFEHPPAIRVESVLAA